MTEHTLDEEVMGDAPGPHNYATPTQRFLTYLIDTIVFYAISMVIGFIMGIMMGGVSASIYIAIYVTLFLYYIALEASSGKTVGKMVMRTRVVTVSGGKPSVGQCFIRTISRLVPLEFISVWIEDSVMWHDQWASTRVIKDER